MGEEGDHRTHVEVKPEVDIEGVARVEAGLVLAASASVNKGIGEDLEVGRGGELRVVASGQHWRGLDESDSDHEGSGEDDGGDHLGDVWWL